MPVLGDAEGGQPPAGGAGAEGGEASGYRSDNIYVRVCTFIQVHTWDWVLVGLLMFELRC